jgi:hypothetical protein
MGDFDKKLEFFRESDAVMTLLGGDKVNFSSFI